LSTGFYDPVFFDSNAGQWLDRSVAAGGDTVRLGLTWREVAPAARPAGFQAEDPADPAYDWAGVDQAVSAAASRGLRVVMTVAGAPAWAEGPGGRGDGTWRPSPGALADFLTAAARRYSGRVRHWQIWNEPNLESHLSPQQAGRRLVAPAHYRDMLNAAFAALQNVDRRNVVVTGGTAPYGDRTGRRTAPVRFLRALLSKPVRFHVLAHHPYSVGNAFRRALGRDDVAIADMAKLTRVVRSARRKGRALPAGRKRFWVTEVSWDSSPPDPDGVPAARHARWLADAFFTLWRAGVDTITWFQVRDAAPRPSYDTTFQSGVYLRNGRPKPARRAFRFPLVLRRSRGRILVWGRAPQPGRVQLQQRREKRWRSLASAATRRSRLFILRTRGASGIAVRAVNGGEASITRRVP
jgi:hypothetical protein